MSYPISSKTFKEPELPELLKLLSAYFHSRGISFYVVGATARDMVLGMIHCRNTGRRTNDLDIAIMVRDWKTFEKIKTDLSHLPYFSKSSTQKQRWHYKDRMILDIIPFGEIARADRYIYWPPDETPAMSVSGFAAMASQSLLILLDDTTPIHVASLPALFILKLAAWHDRHQLNNKDADDMATLLEEYWEINLDRTASQHPDIYDRPDFTVLAAGAQLMGRDINKMLKDDPPLREELSHHLRHEIGQEEFSRLIQQIMETHRRKSYEEVLAALIVLEREIQK